MPPTNTAAPNQPMPDREPDSPAVTATRGMTVAEVARNHALLGFLLAAAVAAGLLLAGLI